MNQISYARDMRECNNAFYSFYDQVCILKPTVSILENVVGTVTFVSGDITLVSCMLAVAFNQ